MFDKEVEANCAAGNPCVPAVVMEQLKEKARTVGLCNLCLAQSERGAGHYAISGGKR